MDSKNLSILDKRVLRYIEWYISSSIESPSVSTIAKATGTYNHVVNLCLENLIKRGFAYKTDDSSSSIRLTYKEPYSAPAQLLYFGFLSMRELWRKKVFIDLTFRKTNKSDEYAVPRSIAISYLNFNKSIQFICVLGHRGFECIILKDGEEYQLDDDSRPEQLIRLDGSQKFETSAEVSGYMKKIQEVIL